MFGIKAYGLYFPFNRLERNKISHFHGGKPQKGERSIANFDEDSLSLAVNACCNLFSSYKNAKPEALYFATTTPPYAEKMGAVTIQSALDLPETIETMDYGHSLRAGSGALKAGLHHRMKQCDILIAASDMRGGNPNSEMELNCGDGAASILIGEGEDVIAELIGSASINSEHLSVWRNEGESYARQWEDRFVQNVALQSAKEALNTALRAAELDLKRIDSALISAPFSKFQIPFVKSLGFTEGQVTEMDDSWHGHLGTANPLAMLAKSLEKRNPGEIILLLNISEGCDAFLFRCSEKIKDFHPHKSSTCFKRYKNTSTTYGEVLKWRDKIEVDNGRRPEAKQPSAPALWRNRKGILSFQGSECKRCHSPFFPAQRVCPSCGSVDEIEPYSFKRKRASIFTYTMDFLASSPSSPSAFAVIDFEGGGRMLAQVADWEEGDLQIGREVEFSFRKLYTASGIHNYFWKAVPTRKEEEA
ncbi:OB-fold domain-containing protein [Falsibacillus pallidus]|uniref:OB-fold domain-containing protein n=1 Tax=Falsibacillus pallidus TaxID=493781 RepID=UPI003D972CF8